MQRRRNRTVLDQIVYIESMLIDSICNVEETGMRPSIDDLIRLNNEIKRLKRIHERTTTNPAEVASESAFMRKVHISNCMSKFMGCQQGQLKSRVDVTKYLCEYIRNNGLQNPTNRREIILDAKMERLFRPTEEDLPVTYFRLQKLLKPHFNGQADKYYSVETIWKAYRAFKIRKFIKICALKNKIKNELEMMPELGIKYFEIKENYEKYLNNIV